VYQNPKEGKENPNESGESDELWLWVCDCVSVWVCGCVTVWVCEWNVCVVCVCGLV
jgi:hypothetical protein